MHMVCEQPENRADHAESVYLQFRDRTDLAQGCVSNCQTRLSMHMVSVQRGDRTGLVQGCMCAA